MLNVDSIHALYEAEFGLKIYRGGQDFVKQSKPFMTYDLVFGKKYKRHQILKEYKGTPLSPAPETPVSPAVEYKNPNQTRIQYTVIFDGSKIVEADSKVEIIDRYFVTDEFKLAMKKLNIGFIVETDITEIKLDIEGFHDRQFLFEIIYFWADVWSRQEGSYIETIAEPTQVNPEEGA